MFPWLRHIWHSLSSVLPGPSRANSVSTGPTPSFSASPQSAATPTPPGQATVDAVYAVHDLTFFQSISYVPNWTLPEEGHKGQGVPRTESTIIPAAATVGICSGPRDAEPRLTIAAAPVAACSGPLFRAGPLATQRPPPVAECLLSQQII